MLVTKYLSSGRALSRSFDKYLQQVRPSLLIFSSSHLLITVNVSHQLLRVLNEPAVHVRTRAMKALSTIVAADPSILLKVSYSGRNLMED